MTKTAPARIDCHFHVWGTAFASRPFPWTPDPFPGAAMLEILDQHGMDRGVDVTPIMYGWDNSYGLEAAAGSERLQVFGRIDPFAPDPAARLRRWMRSPAAAGVRLTFYGDDLRRIDEPSLLDPFWSAAADLGVPVAVFAPDALWQIVHAAERHPGLQLIVDHLGLGVYPGCEDPFAGLPALRELVGHEQVLVKISGAVEISREPYPFADVREILIEARETFGASRLMWGSNYPVVLAACTYDEALSFVDECGFDDAERDMVLGGTCARLLDTLPAQPW